MGIGGMRGVSPMGFNDGGIGRLAQRLMVLENGALQGSMIAAARRKIYELQETMKAEMFATTKKVALKHIEVLG